MDVDPPSPTAPPTVFDVAPASTSSHHPPRRLRRMIFLLATALVGFALLVAVLLLVFQRGLIYFPSPYEAAELRSDVVRAAQLHFETASGPQLAHYVPPAGQPLAGPWPAPERLWVMFHGNASRALDWLMVLEPTPPDPTAGYLLVDYPGYGACAGRPTRAGIIENGQAALAALRAQFAAGEGRTSAGGPQPAEISVAAYSLGCAAALELATRLDAPPPRIVLLAPFTSLSAMARRTVPWPYHHLLYDRFDNQARLAELATRTPPPRLTIIHGEADQVIPVAMGRALAASWTAPGLSLHILPTARHETILDEAAPFLHAAMARP